MIRMNTNVLKKTALVLALSTALVGCDSLTRGERTAAGAGIGAATGAAIGYAIDHSGGGVVGGVIGALAGGAIGYYMDTQQEKMEKALGSSGIRVERIDKSTIKLVLPDSITFPVNKANLSSSIEPSLGQIAAIMNEYSKTVIHVEGHTDNTGAMEYNQKLSLERANNVAAFLESRGVIRQRIVAEGHNFQYPVASNDSEQGRAQNRRVEIFIRAVEKGNESAAYAPIY